MKYGSTIVNTGQADFRKWRISLTIILFALFSIPVFASYYTCHKCIMQEGSCVCANDQIMASKES